MKNKLKILLGSLSIATLLLGAVVLSTEDPRGWGFNEPATLGTEDPRGWGFNEPTTLGTEDPRGWGFNQSTISSTAELKI